MTDPRDTARAWLAGQIARYAGSYWIPANISVDPETVEAMADRWGVFGAMAIINGHPIVEGMPGVTVEQCKGRIRDDGTLYDSPLPPTHTQVVIRLPAQPIKEET